MNIPNKKEFKIDYKGRELSFVTSDIAGQTNASVIGSYGDTSVLVTVVMGENDTESDYFPLTITYEERFYASGKILGSRFMRREGRPSNNAILSGRLIDRTIRPLFDQRIRRAVQVVITVLSYDGENEPDFISLMTTSVALSISNIPWGGPVAGIRTTKKDGEIIFNPTNTQMDGVLSENGEFDAFFAGTKNKINMIEVAGNEMQEDVGKDIFRKSMSEVSDLVKFQEGIIKDVGVEKLSIELTGIDDGLMKEVRAFSDKFEKAMFTNNSDDRKDMLNSTRKELFERLEGLGIDINNIDIVIDEIINEIVHRRAIESNERVDNRKMDELRGLYSEVGLFKRLHGSAYFSRGKTQSLAITTLAAPGAEKLVETMDGTTKKRFMLHYNFPPYSTGETGRMGAPSRREIGHGALAEKALRPMIPSKESFPYTIRVVSEIMSSNGSSSMASVCAGSLSLMDAGVPIKKPVAGIAMGLMTWQGIDRSDDRKEFKILTDIQGPEDHYGDMDFKVAGTKDGINAIQMDVKTEGIDEKIFDDALIAAKKARLQILDVVNKSLDKPRDGISKYAPSIKIISINPEQIGGVIGSGGKVINKIVEDFGLESIDIEESGDIFISADAKEKVEKASKYIQELTKEYEVGDIVEGKIIKLMDFGAIVDLGGGKDGMVHVSEINNEFVKDINSVVKIGDNVKAKVIKVENGKIALSMKGLNK